MDCGVNPCFCATTPLLRDDAIALMDYGRMLLRLFTCRTLQMRHRLPIAKLQFLFSRPSRYPRLLSPGCAVPTAYGSSANAPGLSVLNPASPLCSLGTLQSGDTRGRGIIFCPAFMKCPPPSGERRVNAFALSLKLAVFLFRRLTLAMHWDT